MSQQGVRPATRRQLLQWGVTAGAVAALPAVAGAAIRPVTARITRVACFDADASEAAGGGQGTRVITVGERGTVFLSSDAGETWRQRDSGVETDLTAVRLVGDRAWAVGHRGTIIVSRDAGEHWERAKVALPEGNALFDVAMDGADGWAVGSFGVLAQTRDGGASWQGRPLLDKGNGDVFDRHLYGITRTSTGDLFVVGEAGAMLASRDRGATWRELASPYIGSFFAVATLDDDRLLACGMRGHAFRSDDAGRSWVPVTGVPEGLSIQGVRRIGPRLVTLAGLDGAVFVSRDNGSSFTMLPPLNRRTARVALAGPPGQLLVFGEAGFYRQPLQPSSAPLLPPLPQR